MTNPLLGKTTAGGGGTMKPSDERVVHAKDKDGNIIRTLIVHRTHRKYVEDLCDAYNEACTNPAIEWYVGPSDDLRMGTPLAQTIKLARKFTRNAEDERQRWLENHRKVLVDA